MLLRLLTLYLGVFSPMSWVFLKVPFHQHHMAGGAAEHCPCQQARLSAPARCSFPQGQYPGWTLVSCSPEEGKDLWIIGSGRFPWHFFCPWHFYFPSAYCGGFYLVPLSLGSTPVNIRVGNPPHLGLQEVRYASEEVAWPSAPIWVGLVRFLW